MNTPATLGGNWLWRMESDALTGKLAKKIYRYMQMYGRLPEKYLRKQGMLLYNIECESNQRRKG